MNIQDTTPDFLFTAEQQERLAALMEEWRAARDQCVELAPAKQTELNELIKTELIAATARTKILMQSKSE